MLHSITREVDYPWWSTMCWALHTGFSFQPYHNPLRWRESSISIFHLRKQAQWGHDFPMVTWLGWNWFLTLCKWIHYNTLSCFYSQHFWHQMWGFSTSSNSPVLQLKIELVSYNSISTLPRVSMLSPTKLPSLQMSVVSIRSPCYPHFCLTWLQIRGSRDRPIPPPGLIIC